MVSSPDTRERILSTAARLLSEGDAELSLGRVAQQAGVSRQAVYLHFTGRADLLSATVDHINLRLDLERRTQRVLGLADPTASLDAGVELLVWYNQRAGRAVETLRKTLDLDEEAARVWAKRRSGRRHFLKELCRRLHTAGELRQDLDAAAAADLLGALLLAPVCGELRQHRWTHTRMTHAMVRVARAALLRSAAQSSAAPTSQPSSSRAF